MVVINDDGVMVTTMEGTPVHKEVTSIPWSPSMAEKGGYKHFMLKRYTNNPGCCRYTQGRFSLETGEIYLEEFA